MVGLFAVSCSLIASVGECGCPPLDYQLSEREHFRTREVSSHPPPCQREALVALRALVLLVALLLPVALGLIAKHSTSPAVQKERCV